MYRQGDVYIIPVEDISLGNVRCLDDGVLATGEATGHRHRIAEGDLGKAALYELGGQKFLRVSAEGGISIVHEEHGPIQIAPGLYEVRIQREYFMKSIQEIAD